MRTPQVTTRRPRTSGGQLQLLRDPTSEPTRPSSATISVVLGRSEQIRILRLLHGAVRSQKTKPSRRRPRRARKRSAGENRAGVRRTCGTRRSRRRRRHRRKFGEQLLVVRRPANGGRARAGRRRRVSLEARVEELARESGLCLVPRAGKDRAYPRRRADPRGSHGPSRNRSPKATARPGPAGGERSGSGLRRLVDQLGGYTPRRAATRATRLPRKSSPRTPCMLMRSKVGHGRHQRLRLESWRESPQDERRILAAAPGKGKRATAAALQARRSSPRRGERLGPRVDRLSAHKNLRVRGGGGPAAGAARTALPPRADARSARERSTWLIPERGIAVAGQRRDRTGLRRLCTGRGLCARRSEHSEWYAADAVTQRMPVCMTAEAVADRSAREARAIHGGFRRKRSRALAALTRPVVPPAAAVEIRIRG